MISLIFLLISLYVAWYYRSFKNENEPSWVENGDCIFYASLAEGALEFICLIVYLGVFK